MVHERKRKSSQRIEKRRRRTENVAGKFKFCIFISLTKEMMKMSSVGCVTLTSSSKQNLKHAQLNHTRNTLNSREIEYTQTQSHKKYTLKLNQTRNTLKLNQTRNNNTLKLNHTRNQIHSNSITQKINLKHTLMYRSNDSTRNQVTESCLKSW